MRWNISRCYQCNQCSCFLAIKQKKTWNNVSTYTDKSSRPAFVVWCNVNIRDFLQLKLQYNQGFYYFKSTISICDVCE